MELLQFLRRPRKAVILAVLAAILSGVGTVAVLFPSAAGWWRGQVVGDPVPSGPSSPFASVLAAQMASQLLLLRVTSAGSRPLDPAQLGRQVLATPLRQLESWAARLQATFVQDAPAIGEGLRPSPLLRAPASPSAGDLGAGYWVPIILWAIPAVGGVGPGGAVALPRGTAEGQAQIRDGQEAAAPVARPRGRGAGVASNRSWPPGVPAGVAAGHGRIPGEAGGGRPAPPDPVQRLGPAALLRPARLHRVRPAPVAAFVSHATRAGTSLAEGFSCGGPRPSSGAQLPHPGPGPWRSLRRIKALGANLAVETVEPEPLPPWTTLELAAPATRIAASGTMKGSYWGPWT